MKSRETREQHRVGRPSALAMITAAAASAAAFIVITKSGIAGTLVGAAVFSAVYHGASHWFGGAAERVAAWWLDRRGVKVGGLERPSNDAPAPAAAGVAGAAADNGALAPELADDAFATDTTIAVAPRRPAAIPARRALALWGPLVLAVAALGASGYSVVTGEPIERVIIRERVVEKPVVEERVVVQRETVTVTVTVPPRRDSAGNETAAPASTTTSTTVTTAPSSSTTTSTTDTGGGGSGGATTTTTAAAPSSSSTSLPATTVTTAASPGQ
ncbi:MAG: hypothetical protein ACYC6T_10815 [Thermoleophilia bacterium]